MIRPKPGHKKPSDSWSLGNKILMFLNGTDDARGFKQWQNVGRSVKKGAKAFYILAPAKRKITRKVTDEDTGEEKEEERAIITGFRDVPVFRCEDTEGDPIPKPEYDPLTPPPLHEIAQKAFSGEEPQAALKSVFRVLSDVEKCLDMAFVEDDGEKDAVA